MAESNNLKKAPVLNEPLKVELTEKRRELMFMAMDGNTELAGVMYIFNHYKFCDNILTWLIAHKFTGKNLQEMIVKQFKSSVPALIDYVVECANGKVPSNVRKVES